MGLTDQIGGKNGKIDPVGAILMHMAMHFLLLII